MLVDIDMDNHLILMAEVFLKPNLHGSVAETLVSEIFLGDLGGTVDDVLGNLVALHELETLLKLLTFALFHSAILYFRDTGLSAEIDDKPDFVACDFLGENLSLGEKPLAH